LLWKIDGNEPRVNRLFCSANLCSVPRRLRPRVERNTARSAYFSAQNRHILTNMLSLLGLTEQEMEELIKESEERANTLLTTVPPQLKRLVEEIKAAQEEQDEEERRR
jgi:hypothetical protein